MVAAVEADGANEKKGDKGMKLGTVRVEEEVKGVDEEVGGVVLGAVEEVLGNGAGDIVPKDT
jgi:hypothetical protein